MNRRLFFKNIFGATFVAVIPKPMFDTIVSLPEPKPIIGVDIGKGKDYQGLWIFDMQDNFITRSQDVAINVKQHWIDVTSWRDIETQYIPGSPSYQFTANNLEKSISTLEFAQGKKYKSVFVKGGYRICGECYLEELLITSSIEDHWYRSAIFTVSGVLIIQNLNQKIIEK